MFLGFPRPGLNQTNAAPQNVSRSRNNVLVQQANNLIGSHVKINRGGPDAVDGTLLAIPSNYLVVGTKDGIIYVNGIHVKSITEVSKSGNGSGGRSGTTYIVASSFNSLLPRLRHQFIQINRGGPEKLEGFLAETNSDYLLLVVGKEVIRVPSFHIKTVSTAGKSGGNKSNNNKSNKSNKSNNKSGNNSGNKSKSKR